MKIIAVTLVALLVVVALPWASARSRGGCPRPNSSPSPYDCWNNHDHNELTLRKINCNSQYNAASLAGCLAICTPAPYCYGVVFIPDQYGWLQGRYCCVLKRWGMRCSWIKRQHNRITCRWVGTGGDSTASADPGRKTKEEMLLGV